MLQNVNMEEQIIIQCADTKGVTYSTNSPQQKGLTIFRCTAICINCCYDFVQIHSELFYTSN